MFFSFKENCKLKKCPPKDSYCCSDIKGQTVEIENLNITNICKEN